MNKIYNNLSIENLVKTDWLNNFEEKQKVEILEGLKNNVDISIYANPEYSWVQMKEIRESLEVKSDYAWFIEKEFGSFDVEENKETIEEVVKNTIEEIRKGLK